MPRLIEADKVAEAIAWLDEYDFVIWHDVQKCIDKLPTVDIDAITETHEKIGYDKGYRDGYAQATVDAEPVVRCKECESWGLNAIKKDEKGEVIYGDCLHFRLATPKWFYCAWGERREDAETD